MELKKGFYFTIDSLVAGGIIIILIILISSFYIKEQSYLHLNYLSQDVARVLETMKVSEIDNNYVKSLINDGTITHLDNTLLEQIGEFWAQDQMVFANKTASNITSLWVSDTTGIGIWINNENVYSKNVPIKKSLISSKKIISGIKKGQAPSSNTRQNPPVLWGPAIAEVRVWE